MTKSLRAYCRTAVWTFFVISAFLFVSSAVACENQSTTPTTQPTAAPTPNLEATIEARVQAALDAPQEKTSEAGPNKTTQETNRQTAQSVPVMQPTDPPTPLPNPPTTPTREFTPTVIPTPSPSPKPTATPSPASMTVLEYATWCGVVEKEAPLSDADIQQTNQEVIEAIDLLLEERRELQPPVELAKFHDTGTDALVAVKSSLSLEPPDGEFNPFSLFGVALVMGTAIEQAEADLSEQTRSLLLATGCIEPDLPEPTSVSIFAATATPVPTPTGPGFSVTNPVEVGDTLEGTDGTRIIVLGTVQDAWPHIQSESQSAFGSSQPPAEGHQFYLVSVQVAFAQGSGSISVSGENFKILDDSLVVIDSGCGWSNTVPNELSGEIFVGGKLTGNVCFEVRQAAGNFILIHQPDYYTESRRFLRVE